MKLLFENWRQYLNEAIDPRIQKQMDGLLAFPNVGVLIYGSGRKVTFKYVQINDIEAGMHPGNYSDLGDEDRGEGKPSGLVQILKAGAGIADDGNCLGGYTVMYTRAEKGWGPLLYEIAIEWASQNGAGLTPDRSIVSQHALDVWNKYAARSSDFDIKQMDVSHDIKGPNRFKNNSVDQITPEDKTDDCDQYKAIEIGGKEEWVKTSLSKMYYKETPEVMQTLEGDGRLLSVI